jgi:hypothetical protein
MTTQELYKKANDLCNSIDSSIRERAKELHCCGSDLRYIQLGKLQEAYERAADSRQLLSAIDNHEKNA